MYTVVIYLSTHFSISLLWAPLRIYNILKSNLPHWSLKVTIHGHFGQMVSTNQPTSLMNQCFFGVVLFAWRSYGQLMWESWVVVPPCRVMSVQSFRDGPWRVRLLAAGLQIYMTWSDLMREVCLGNMFDHDDFCGEFSVPWLGSQCQCCNIWLEQTIKTSILIS